MTMRKSLFDDIERTDASVMRHNESLFECLNRSSRREVIDICDRLESWFKRFPAESQDDVRGRFRSDDDNAHQGATFELLIHELLIRLGCRLKVHPEISGSRQRPDFLAQHKDCSFYIEATVIDPSEGLCARNPLEEDVVAKINKLASPHFYIIARVEGKLSKALSWREVAKPFADFLEAHDPDDVQRMIDEGYPAPSRGIEVGTWSFNGELFPIPLKKRGIRSRTLVIGPARGGPVDSSTPIQRGVIKKAKKYGQLNAPLVVAANVTRDFFLDRDSEMEALFGKLQVNSFRNLPNSTPELGREPDGVWIQGGYKPRYKRLTAVWIFHGITPWNLCDAANCLYINPFDNVTKLPAVMYRLSYASARGNKMQWFEGENIGQLLGVSDDRQTK